MGMLDYFMASRKRSAGIAKERLQILVAHERAERDGPSYLPMLQKEIMDVIRKYVAIDPRDVSVSVDHEGQCEILALNVVLPDPPPGKAQLRRA
jgi:cell division topological specificity factor